jgi:hypothetical protein
MKNVLSVMSADLVSGTQIVIQAVDSMARMQAQACMQAQTRINRATIASQCRQKYVMMCPNMLELSSKLALQRAGSTAA